VQSSIFNSLTAYNGAAFDICGAAL